MPFSSPDINDLAHRIGLVDFEELMLKQGEEGLQVFIPQLSLGEVYEGTGWSLRAPDFGLYKYSSGWLTVLNGADVAELNTYLDSKLDYKSTWEKVAVLRRKQAFLRSNSSANESLALEQQPHLPGGYRALPFAGFKALPKWGINHEIVMPVLLKNSDGSFSVQVKRRVDGVYAFIGGMVEATSKSDQDANRVEQIRCEQAAQIFLAEMYGNDLFAENSMSLSYAQQVPEAIVRSAWDLLFEEIEFIFLRKYRPEEVIYPASHEFDHNAFLEDMLRNLKEKCIADGVREETYRTIESRIKCYMYQKLFAREAGHMQEQLTSKLQQLSVVKEIDSVADPRNTSGEGGFVRSMPLYLVLDAEELPYLQQRWLVDPKGGDDVINIEIMTIEDFFSSKVFASHRQILMTVLTDMIVRDEVYLESEALQKQLENIEQQILQFEKNLAERKGIPLAIDSEEEPSQESDQVQGVDPEEVASIRSGSGVQTEPHPLNEERPPSNCWNTYIAPMFRSSVGSTNANDTPRAPLLSDRVNDQRANKRPTRLGNCCVM